MGTEEGVKRHFDPDLRALLFLARIRCPDCGGPLVYGEGHVRCPICGYTRRK